MAEEGLCLSLIHIFSLAWFVVYGFGTQIRITGQSMTPELRSEDVVLMNRLSYDLGRDVYKRQIHAMAVQGKQNVADSCW